MQSHIRRDYPHIHLYSLYWFCERRGYESFELFTEQHPNDFVPLLWMNEGKFCLTILVCPYGWTSSNSSRTSLRRPDWCSILTGPVRPWNDTWKTWQNLAMKSESNHILFGSILQYFRYCRRHRPGFAVYQTFVLKMTFHLWKWHNFSKNTAGKFFPMLIYEIYLEPEVISKYSDMFARFRNVLHKRRWWTFKKTMCLVTDFSQIMAPLHQRFEKHH